MALALVSIGLVWAKAIEPESKPAEGNETETKITTWDFTTALSEADIANFTADKENWKDDTEKNRFENLTAVSGELKANGVAIEKTKGITFGSFKASSFRIGKENTLYLNGAGLSFTITAKKGSKLTIESVTAKTSDATRYLSATNLKVEKGFEASGEQITNVGEVEEDGDVTITTTIGGINISKITLEEPAEATSESSEDTAEEAELETIFSWTGAKDAAVVEGGAITAADKDGADKTKDLINVEQKNFYTIKVDGKKDFTSGNTITIKLDKALEAGDKIAITAFRNKNDANKKSGLLAKFDKGEKTLSTVSSDKEKAGLEFVNLDDSEKSAADKNRGKEPNTLVLDIPEEAAGSTTITLTRAETSTNLFVTKLVILGDRNPDKNLSFDNYKSLDFNSAVNGAVSRGGRHAGDITAPLTINAPEATLTITPNVTTADYPEGTEPCSKFVETMAGPQLVISGGYSGATLKLKAVAAPFQQINFKQTNFSDSVKVDKGSFDPKTGIWTAPIGTPITELTFTITADTSMVCKSKYEPVDLKKPDGDQKWVGFDVIEVVLHDMGIWKINKILINPSEAIDEKVAAGTDLSAFVAEKIAELKKDDINPKYVKLELEAGKNYTVTNAIEVGCPLTIIGNGAIIDATASDGEFFVLSANPTTDYLDKSDKYYGIDKVLFDNINVVGLKKSIFTDSNIKYAVVDFVITGCVFQLETESTLNDALISFFAGGIKNFTVENSTFYGNGKGAKYFVRYNNGATIKRIAGTSDWTSDHLTFTYTNNTFYNLLKSDGEWVNAGGAANGSINTIVKNIWYNCGKSAFAQKVIAGGRLGSGSSATWQNNTYYRSGEDNSSNQTNYDKSGTILTTNPGFADAAKGDFTLSTTSDQYTNQTGDPRWFDGTGKALAIEGSGSGAITGIEAVKEAKTAEDGAWYTIQGQRVAQPTKGLYIHNGKKVVIK